jgi:tRNA uridine 5-carbamoylmethylation protein Kti12
MPRPFVWLEALPGPSYQARRSFAEVTSATVVATGKPILIVTGPPGVGKTTTARALAKRSPRVVHLEADAFFRFIRSGYVAPWKRESREQNELVMGIVAQAAGAYATAGYFTIVDGIVIPRWFLTPLRDALRNAGHSVAYAVLRAPLAVCTERARSREREPLAEQNAIEQLWREFEDLGDLEPNAVDASGVSAEGIADVLQRHLAEGSLTI